MPFTPPPPSLPPQLETCCKRCVLHACNWFFLHIIFPSFFTKTKVTKLFVGKDIYNGCLFQCVSYYSLNFCKTKMSFVAFCGCMQNFSVLVIEYIISVFLYKTIVLAALSAKLVITSAYKRQR